MSESKAREFWIDSAPLFNGLDMYPYKKAFDNIQDAEEMIVGNTYHVIEKSAYDKAVEALKEISKYTSAYSGASSPEANKAKKTLRELGVE